jgi:hypothetical protein
MACGARMGEGHFVIRQLLEEPLGPLLIFERLAGFGYPALVKALQEHDDRKEETWTTDNTKGHTYGNKDEAAARQTKQYSNIPNSFSLLTSFSNRSTACLVYTVALCRTMKAAPLFPCSRYLEDYSPLRSLTPHDLLFRN